VHVDTLLDHAKDQIRCRQYLNALTTLVQAQQVVLSLFHNVLKGDSAGEPVSDLVARIRDAAEVGDDKFDHDLLSAWLEGVRERCGDVQEVTRLSLTAVHTALSMFRGSSRK
jgi:hypothetical protein